MKDEYMKVEKNGWKKYPRVYEKGKAYDRKREDAGAEII